MVNKLLDKGTTKGVLPVHHDDEKLCNDFEQFFHEKIEKIRKDIEEEIRNSPSNAVGVQEERIQLNNELKEFTLLTAEDLKQILKQMSMKY